MSTPAPQGDTAFRGNSRKETTALLAWLADGPPEDVLEPWLPIVDPHHHLFGTPQDARYYCMPDLLRDLGSGHRLIGTVYVEALRAGWRSTGPEALQPVGEVEMIVGQAPDAVRLPAGDCRIAEGIVAYADLLLGDAIGEVLDAQIEAGHGRMRGTRYMAARDPGTVGRFLTHDVPPHLLADPRCRRALAQLQARGLSFDAFVFHHQLQDVIDLADALPGLTLVLDHAGTLLGVEEHRTDHAAAFRQWQQDLRALAARPNVWLKLGGLGMPMFGFGFEHRLRPASSQELALAWQPYVDACLEAFGPRRCMLESNFPIDKQSCGYLQLWNGYKRATRALSTDERRHLFYRAACGAYRLPQLQAIGDAIPAP